MLTDKFKVSSFSGPNPNYACVAVKKTEDAVLVRHSKATKQISFSYTEWNAFISGVKNDEFNI